MIYIPSFINSGLDTQRLIRGDTHTDADRQHGDLISLFLFFQNKEIGLKMQLTRSFFISMFSFLSQNE
jgi:hypothetical protein